jgi:hypothetical protein
VHAHLLGAFQNARKLVFTSSDGAVLLEQNGRGLLTRVTINPTLEGNTEAIEKAVLDAASLMVPPPLPLLMQAAPPAHCPLLTTLSPGLCRCVAQQTPPLQDDSTEGLEEAISDVFDQALGTKNKKKKS